MLNERDYMRRGPVRTPASGNAMLLALVILNTALFLLIPPDSELMLHLVMCSGTLPLMEPWRLLTSFFLHGSFSHLFFNMFGLFVFGQLIANRLGQVRMLWLYLASGLIGNLLWLLLNLDERGAIMLGASGSVMGITAASALIMPNVEMFALFIPFPVKLRVLAVVYFLLDVLGGIFSSSPIAYTAHVGGFLAGALFVRIFAKDLMVWNPFTAFSRKKNPAGADALPPGWSVRGPAPDRARELDRILDKLSRNGINSLTEEELETLRRARDEMNHR